MKKQYLKDRTAYVKEHMSQFGSSNVDNTENAFNFGSKKEEETEEETEETPAAAAEAEAETETPEGEVIGKGVGAEFQVGDDTVAVGVAVAAQSAADAEVAPIDALPAADQQPAGFTPSFDTGHSYKQEWAIIKVMTNNGVRVGLDKQSETDCEVLCGNLSYQDAVLKVDEISKQSNIPAFNDDMDEYIGKVSKAYIKKPSTPSTTASVTSYKPNPANFGGNSMGGAM
jgi:hypothetical protein